MSASKQGLMCNILHGTQYSLWNTHIAGRQAVLVNDAFPMMLTCLLPEPATAN